MPYARTRTRGGQKGYSEMIIRQAYDSNTDKEEALEKALQILAKAERFMRLATDSRLSSEDRQIAARKAEEVMQELAEHCMSYSLQVTTHRSHLLPI